MSRFNSHNIGKAKIRCLNIAENKTGISYQEAKDQGIQSADSIGFLWDIAINGASFGSFEEIVNNAEPFGAAFARAARRKFGPGKNRHS